MWRYVAWAYSLTLQSRTHSLPRVRSHSRHFEDCNRTGFALAGYSRLAVTGSGAKRINNDTELHWKVTNVLITPEDVNVVLNNRKKNKARLTADVTAVAFSSEVGERSLCIMSGRHVKTSLSYMRRDKNKTKQSVYFNNVSSRVCSFSGHKFVGISSVYVFSKKNWKMAKYTERTTVTAKPDGEKQEAARKPTVKRRARP